MNKESILKEFQQDLSDAANQKSTIDGKIINWLTLYNTKEDKTLRKDNRSAFIYRLIRKQVKTQTSVISDSFAKPAKLFVISGFNNKTVRDIERMSQIIHHTWQNKIQTRTLVHDVYTISAKEGTVIGKLGVSNYFPTCKLVKNESFYLDPTATSLESAQYMIHKMSKTYSDLKKDEANGIYSDVDKLKENYAGDNYKENSLETYRNSTNNIDTTKQFSGSRKKYDIYEYWGFYDLNGDGIAEAIVCTFCGNVILRLEESPFGDVLPFIFATYDRDSNNFWGDALPELIENNQKIVTALSRSIIENAAYNNTNIKMTKKGALDFDNRRRLEQGVPGTVIEVNTNGSVADAMMPLPVEQVNPQTFSMIELFKQDAEEQTGISKNMTGTTEQYTTARQTSLGASYGEKRILDYVERSIETFWKPMVKTFIQLIIDYMPQEEVIRITGDEDFVQWTITPDDVKIDLNISGLDTAKIQEMVNMLQYLTMATKDTDVNPQIIPLVVSKICEIQGFTDIADIIRDSKPVPNEMEQAKVQADMALAQAEIQVKQSEAERNMAEIEMGKIKAMNATTGMKLKEAVTASNIENKRANTVIKATETAQKGVTRNDSGK